MTATAESNTPPGSPKSGARVKPRASREKNPRVERDTEPGEYTLGTLVAAGFMLVTILIVAFAGFLLVGSGLQADRTQDVMYSELKTSLAEATVPVSAPIAPGASLGVIELPRLGVEQVFVKGSSSEQTMSGPGLKSDSVLPGQAGSSVLVGRRTTFGAPFADLDQLRIGDRILITTGQGKFTYVVDLVRTSDAPATSIESVPSRLSLVTSDPPLTPSRTLIVSATLSEKALPASTATFGPPEDVPGARSFGRAVPLLLWSQLLLLATGLVTWAAIRVPGRAVWIWATPVLVAILWNVFENLAALLPNTF